MFFFLVFLVVCLCIPVAFAENTNGSTLTTNSSSSNYSTGESVLSVGDNSTLSDMPTGGIPGNGTPPDMPNGTGPNGTLPNGTGFYLQP